MDKTLIAKNGEIRIYDTGVDIKNASRNEQLTYEEIIKVDFSKGTKKEDGTLDIYIKNKKGIRLKFGEENNDEIRLARTYIWDKIKPEKPIDQLSPKEQEKQKLISKNKANGIAYCPKCGSTSLSGDKKGFGIGKAVVGAALIGGIGLMAGNIGAKKVRITCLNCGHQYMAGK